MMAFGTPAKGVDRPWVLQALLVSAVVCCPLCLWCVEVPTHG